MKNISAVVDAEKIKNLETYLDISSDENLQELFIEILPDLEKMVKFYFAEKSFLISFHLILISRSLASK